MQGPSVERHVPFGVPGLVRQQAEARPGSVALVDETGTTSYHQLELASDGLAARLRAAGGQPGDVVAVCMPRSRATVVALLAAMKAGMPYLPLAPEDPPARREDLLRRAGARLALVAEEPESGSDGVLAGVDGLTRLQVDAAASATTLAPLKSYGDDHPVYVLFTSGSSGEPKGVVVPVLALCNRLLWMCEEYGFSPDDRILQKTPYTFDVSGWELWAPLISGAREVLLPPGAHRDPGALVDWVTQHGVTVCHFVPSMLEELLRWPGADRCTSLRMVVCSGEALTPGQVRRFNRLLPAELHNLYGPTEAAIDVTYWRCPSGDEPLDRVLIGRPIANCTLAVVDDDLAPVPDGEVGQLAIGGMPLATGYLHRPDLTAAAFVPAPPWAGVPRLYLTGDLVRRHGDELEYLGRRDDQVKVRGHRIELAEVEDVLRLQAEVRDAAVVAVDRGRGTELCAFVVPSVEPAADLAGVVGDDPASGPAAAAGDEPVPGPASGAGEDRMAARLRAAVGDSLPEAFVPAHVLPADRIPLTSSGKQDKRELRDRAERHLAAAERPRPAEVDDELAGFWLEALGALPNDESLGFLDAGGHSLAAARLLGRLAERWGVRISLAALLRQNMSLAQLRETLPARADREGLPAGADQEASSTSADQEVLPAGADRQGLPAGAAADHLAPRPVGALQHDIAVDHAAAGELWARETGDGAQHAPIAPEQRRLWLWSRLFPDCPAYNVVGVLDVEGDVDAPRLRDACAALIVRHSVLRTVVDDGQQQVVLDEAQPLLRVRSAAAGASWPEAVQSFTSGLAARVFPPGRLPRAVFGLLRSESRSAVVVVVDHLVSDQRSLDLLLADLAASYDTGGASEGPAVQFADLVVRRAAAADPDRRQADLQWWQQRLADLDDHLELPFRKARPVTPSFRGAAQEVELGARESRELDEACRRHRVTPSTLTLACLARTVAAWSGREDVVVGLPMSGRELPDELDAVGFFVTTLPVRITVPPAAQAADLLGHVADAVVEAADHASVTFDEIVAQLGAGRDLGRNPIFQVWFNDLTQAEPPQDFGGLPARPVDPPIAWSLFDVGLYLGRSPEGCYRLRLVHATDLWDADAAAAFLAQCHDHLLQVISTDEVAADDVATTHAGVTGGVAAEPAVAADGVATAEHVAADGVAVEQAGTEALPAGPRPPAAVGGVPGEPRTCDALVEQVRSVARDDPERPACVTGRQVVTYSDLDVHLRRVSALVRSSSAGPGQLVAVLARRHPGLAAAVLGAWHAGSPVLVLAADAPRGWRDAVLAETAPALVLSVEDAQRTDVVPAEGPALPLAPGSPGHALPTSGTSGAPAVPLLPAEALPEAFASYVPALELTQDDVFCFTAPPAHDPFFRDLVLPLTIGATVHVPEPQQVAGPLALLDVLATTGTTVLHLTPSHATLLAGAGADQVLPRLRRVVFHGEPLSDQLAVAVQRLAPEAALFNLYGTTETPQASGLSRWRSPEPGTWRANRRSVPLLPAGPHRELVVTTARGEARIGEVGELVVTGTGLALGQLAATGREGPAPGQVAATGRDRPAAGPEPGGSPVRSYRTGDLARRDLDGAVELLGRADRQVLLRGYRVEPAGVERMLLDLPGVRAAVVAPSGPDELHAWLVADAVPPEQEIIRHLRQHLPDWSLPSRYVEVDELPLTANGKVDLAALRAQQAPDGARGRSLPDRGPQLDSGDGVEGVDDLVELVVAAARPYVGEEHVLAPDTGFFDAGLTSMSLVLLHDRLAASGLEVSVAELFGVATPRALAERVATRRRGPDGPGRPTGRHRPRPPERTEGTGGELALRRRARRRAGVG